MKRLLTAATAAMLAVAMVTGMAGSRATATPGPSLPEPGWRWPVDGPRHIERPFIAPAQPWAAGHRGVDLRAPHEGAAVRAVRAGTVHFAGVVVDRPLITIRAGNLLITVEPVSPIVTEGERVEAGQVIGELVSGHCVVDLRASPCLHLGVRITGEYVSPLLYLGGLRRAVLLPLSP